MSSPAPSPSASPAPEAPVAASPSTPASPDTTTPTRPEGLPDSYWDATANALKVDPAALVADLRERDELKAFKAAEDVRRGSLPKDAAGYKVELPADFKAPAGVEFKFDAADPILAQAQALAHANGLSQDGFSKMLGLYAAAKVGEQAQIDAARTAEVAKLGPTASARVDSVVNWLSGMDPTADKGDAKALAGMLVTARHVEAFERIITRLTSQGSASFSQQHRVAPDTDKIPGFENMSFEQKRHAQDQAAARRRTA